MGEDQVVNVHCPDEAENTIRQDISPVPLRHFSYTTSLGRERRNTRGVIGGDTGHIMRHFIHRSTGRLGH